MIIMHMNPLTPKKDRSSHETNHITQALAIKAGDVVISKSVIINL